MLFFLTLFFQLWYHHHHHNFISFKLKCNIFILSSHGISSVYLWMVVVATSTNAPATTATLMMTYLGPSILINMFCLIYFYPQHRHCCNSIYKQAQEKPGFCWMPITFRAQIFTRHKTQQLSILLGNQYFTRHLCWNEETTQTQTQTQTNIHTHTRWQ